MFIRVLNADHKIFAVYDDFTDEEMYARFNEIVELSFADEVIQLVDDDEIIMESFGEI